MLVSYRQWEQSPSLITEGKRAGAAPTVKKIDLHQQIQLIIQKLNELRAIHTQTEEALKTAIGTSPTPAISSSAEAPPPRSTFSRKRLKNISRSRAEIPENNLGRIGLMFKEFSDKINYFNENYGLNYKPNPVRKSSKWEAVERYTKINTSIRNMCEVYSICDLDSASDFFWDNKWCESANDVIIVAKKLLKSILLNCNLVESKEFNDKLSEIIELILGTLKSIGVGTEEIRNIKNAADAGDHEKALAMASAAQTAGQIKNRLTGFTGAASKLSEFISTINSGRISVFDWIGRDKTKLNINSIPEDKIIENFNVLKSFFTNGISVVAQAETQLDILKKTPTQDGGLKIAEYPGLENYAVKLEEVISSIKKGLSNLKSKSLTNLKNPETIKNIIKAAKSTAIAATTEDLKAIKEALDKISGESTPAVGSADAEKKPAIGDAAPVADPPVPAPVSPPVTPPAAETPKPAKSPIKPPAEAPEAAPVAKKPVPEPEDEDKVHQRSRRAVDPNEIAASANRPFAKEETKKAWEAELNRIVPEKAPDREPLTPDKIQKRKEAAIELALHGGENKSDESKYKEFGLGIKGDARKLSQSSIFWKRILRDESVSGSTDPELSIPFMQARAKQVIHQAIDHGNPWALLAGLQEYVKDYPSTGMHLKDTARKIEKSLTNDIDWQPEEFKNTIRKISSSEYDFEYPTKNKIINYENSRWGKEWKTKMLGYWKTIENIVEKIPKNKINYWAHAIEKYIHSSKNGDNFIVAVQYYM